MATVAYGEVNLRLFVDGWLIQISDFSPYGPAKDKDEGPYDFSYDLDVEPGFEPSSKQSVAVCGPDGTLRRCLLTSSGGASIVHENSVLVRGRSLIVAVGPWMCALRLPGLDLDWRVMVDGATCFGVYYSQKHECYVSHGELQVARVTLDGTVVWSASGKDVFSEGFSLHDDFVEVVDSNLETYRIDLVTGDSSIVE